MDRTITVSRTVFMGEFNDGYTFIPSIRTSIAKTVEGELMRRRFFKKIGNVLMFLIAQQPLKTQCAATICGRAFPPRPKSLRHQPMSREPCPADRSPRHGA